MRVCQNCQKDFKIESEDFSFYEKMGVPAPAWCPHCRFIRRMMFINQRSLYKRTCGHCAASIISMYNGDVSLPVWCVKCYLSDAWDARDYGRDYDFSRNFFEQYKELKYSIPHRALDQNERNGEGCEYSNLCYGSKDVYLSFYTVRSENLKYCSCSIRGNKNCLDSMIIKENEKGYELVQSTKNYNSTFLVESEQCIDSHFLFDCINCVNCCLSSNLRNKSYMFKNKQLFREDYEEAVALLHLETYSGQSQTKEIFREITQKAIYKHAHIKNSINAVGDFVINSKNVFQCCGVSKAENVKYAFFAFNTMKDSQDLIFTGKVEECYESTLAGRGGNKLIFSLGCGGGSTNLFYCDSCRGCSDCFGCVGLSQKQYCVFNKQYEEKEYFEFVDKIKKHISDMPYVDGKGRKYPFGESFPAELSPFAYNESSAFEEMPLTKEEVISLGYKWRDPESKSYIPTITSDQIPDSVLDVSDEITKDIIECPNKGKVESQCTSAYRILPDELAFYKQMNLPIPRYCPNCRYHARLKWKNPFRFYDRECMCELSNHAHKEKCQNKFETMYSPERPEVIYCKECYQKEVY